MNSTIKKIFGYSAVVLGSALVAGVTTYGLMEKHLDSMAMSSPQTDSFAMPTAIFDSKPAQPVDLTDAAENSIHAVVHIKSTQLGRTQTIQQMPDLFDFFFSGSFLNGSFFNGCFLDRSFLNGSLFDGSLFCAASNQANNHDQSQQQSNKLLHFVFLLKF